MVLNNTKNSPAESPFRESPALTLVKGYGWITFAAAITVVAINFFFISTGLALGGITGFSLVCSIVFDIPVSMMSPCISISLLISSTIALGKSFDAKTLYIALATPLLMKLIPSIHTIQSLLDIHPLLELAVADPPGGLLVGAVIGIVLNHTRATGSMDTTALLIQYVFKFLEASTIPFFLDGSTVIASGVITQNALIFIFSFLPLMIIIQAISFVTKHKLSA